MKYTLTNLTGGMRLDRTLLFTFSGDISTCGRIYKLYKQHAPMRDREQSFGVCIENEWNNLPSWVVEAEHLDKLKLNLDTHLNARQYLSPFSSCSQ